jgi:putative ABC transport system permease protein
MWALVWRGLWTHKRRLIGTSIATFVGVAFLSGTLVFGDTLRAGFEGLFSQVNAGRDVVVRGTSDVGEADLQTAGPSIDDSLLDVVRSIDGVVSAEPTIEGYGQIVGPDGEAIGGGGPPTLAANWIEDPELNPYRVVEGRPPRDDDEVVLNRGAARAARLGVGDRAMIRTPAPVRVTVVGLATFGDTDGLGPTTYTAFTLAAAQRHLTGRSGQISTIVVEAAEGVSQDELASRIETVLPAGVEAITGEELTRENLEDVSADFVDALSGFLVVFAGIALLVASISIHNTLSIVVAQRSRQAALLRAIGARRSQVVSSVLAEAAVVGVVAATVGAVAGLGLSWLLEALFHALGFPLPTNGLTVEPSSLFVAVTVGVVVTLLASVLPAIRSSRVAPIEALRNATTGHRAASAARLVSGATSGIGGVGALVLAAAGAGGTPLIGLGALATLVASVVLGPVVGRGAMRLIGAPVARLRGTSGALARGNAMRDPQRSAGAAAALLLGVAVVTFLTVFVASLGASVEERVTQSVTADLVVNGGAFGGGGLSPVLAADIASLPQVDEAVGRGTGAALVGGIDQEISVADPGSLARMLDLGAVEGSLAILGPDRIAISRATAAANGWELGAELPVQFIDGASVPLEIGAVYERADLIGDVVIPREVWELHAVQDVDTMVLIRLVEDATLATGRAAVERLTGAYGLPEVLTAAELATQTTSFLDNLLGVVYAMLALTVLIALMGIANTLTLSIHERASELGVLRAVGQTRNQLRAMIRWESAIVAAFGTAAGVGIGLLIAWALVTSTAGEGGLLGTLSVPIVPLLVVLAVGVTAGVLAGVLPARRAARRDLLAGIAAE